MGGDGGKLVVKLFLSLQPEREVSSFKGCHRRFTGTSRKGDYIEDTRDTLGLQKLSVESVIVAAQVEELRQDLRGEGADVDRRCRGIIRDGWHAVAIDAAHLAFLVVELFQLIKVNERLDLWQKQHI
ncbi:Uncharacterized protein Fot_57098 [Forsythia ovata]|uniref:Uncharacterized protein n=1 Tax=Forsythia ovata TaxID=205694 RepID=A0ABD1NWS5_9LAMI